MNKIAIFLALCSVTFTMIIGDYNCTLEQCGDKNPSSTLSLIDESRISQSIEAELRRQYWYYLKNSELIKELKFNTNERLITYYFHRNDLGTFFSICSWYYRRRYSEVNTVVRLGSGWSIELPKDQDLMNVDPRLLIAGSEQWAVNIEYDELGNLVLSDAPELSLLAQVNSTFSISSDDCSAQADEYIRENYDHYIRGAVLLSQKTLDSHASIYQTFTYASESGTYFVIARCSGSGAKVSTFVRLSSGSVAGGESSISLSPEIIQNFSK